MHVAEKYLTQKNRTVAYRIKVEEEGEEEIEEEIDKQAIMLYIQSLSPEEQMEIYQKFQQMKSEEEVKAFSKELLQRGKASGVIK
jgi:transcription-repair coupling factor (superfamily II helicase)